MTGMPKTREALAFQRSVVRSGEPYTSQVDSSYRAALAEVSAVERVVEAARALAHYGIEHSLDCEAGNATLTTPPPCICGRNGLLVALAELDEQTPEADTSAGEAPAGRPSASGVCPCRVHGDPDGDCGENCG